MISVLNPKKIIPKLFEHKTYYLSLAFVFTVVSLADMVILYHYISAHSTHSLPRITSVSTHQVQSQAMPTNPLPQLLPNQVRPNRQRQLPSLKLSLKKTPCRLYLLIVLRQIPPPHHRL